MIAGRRRLAIALLVLVGGGAAAGLPTEPVNVVQQMETALNSGNVEAFLAWFAPQGRVVERGGTVYATRDAIRGWAQALIAHNYRTTGNAYTLNGTRVTWPARVEFDDLRALGVQSVDSRAEAVVEGGKVVVLTPAFNQGSIALLSSAAARQLEERVRAFVDAAYTQGRPGAVDEFCAARVIDHAPLPGGFPTLDGINSGLATLRAAFPDLKATVEGVIASGDRVVARVAFAGTHKGPWQGAPATFRPVTFSSMEEFRYEDGKFVEHWGQLDLAGLNRQIGVAEPAAAGAPVDKQYRKKGNGGILGWLF